MKKFIKLILVLAIITCPFGYISDMFFYHLFSFNILSVNDWRKVSAFWNSGGVIKTAKDYWFFASIIFNPIFFLIIWRFFYKISFINILLFPINKYNDIIIKRYGKNSKRIVLKNICFSGNKKEAIQDLKPNIEASKKASQGIREAVREKLTNN